METLTVVLQQQILKLLCECLEALAASNRGGVISERTRRRVHGLALTILSAINYIANYSRA